MKNLVKKICAALLSSAGVMTAAAFPASAANTGWNLDSTGWWYQNPNGSYERDGWAMIS